MQRYFAVGKHDNQFILGDGDVHHILNVMRMKNMEHIEVVFDNMLYDCYIDITFDLKVFINEEISVGGVGELDVVMIMPILKEQKMDVVLQKATELGVSKIIPVMLERCVVKVNDKEDKKIERWRRIVKEASEQSKRVSIPIIDKICKIDDLVFDDGVKLVCSTKENVKKFKNIMQMSKNCGRMYIVAGPEGGLSVNEECKLNDLGFVSVSLGSRILRVETVPLYVLSCINYELE